MSSPITEKLRDAVSQARWNEAVALLRVTHLGDAYDDAWDSWEASDEAGAWDAVSADGLGI